MHADVRVGSRMWFQARLRACMWLGAPELLEDGGEVVGQVQNGRAAVQIELCQASQPADGVVDCCRPPFINIAFQNDIAVQAA